MGLEIWNKEGDGDEIGNLGFGVSNEVFFWCFNEV